MPLSPALPCAAVTADVALFTMRAEDLALLLVKRKGAPFKGQWALPGGEVNDHEGLEQAAARELARETGFTGIPLEQLGAFGDPGRDPRGHAVSVAFFTFVVAESHPVQVGDDAAETRWIPLREIALEEAVAPKGAHRLAFDHAAIILNARERLKERRHDQPRPSVFDIVPPRFTLTELQLVYEAVFGRPLDKRNFRARLIGHGLIEPVATARRTGPHRPAQLYRFRKARR